MAVGGAMKWLIFAYVGMLLWLPPNAHAGQAPAPATNIQVITGASARASTANVSVTQLEAMATKLAGVPVTLSCETPDVIAAGFGPIKAGLQIDGYTVSDALGVFQPVIHMRQGYCLDLERLPSRNHDPHDGDALLTLIHESMHIGLESSDECQVERVAIANGWQLLRQFGLPARDVPRLLAGMRQFDRALPAVYHGC